MSEPTAKQYAEFFRQIVVGRIGRDELQSLLDIPCHVSAPVEATAHIDALRSAAKSAPFTTRGRWLPDEYGIVEVIFQIATLPSRNSSYNEATIREVLESKGLRLPTLDEYFVCTVGQRVKWFGTDLIPCKDGSFISSFESERGVRYLAVEALAPDAETMSCDCDCAIDETVDDVGGRCETGVFPCRSK